LGYGTSTTSETGFYSSMQEKDTQQLCRMSFLKVHRLFSAPKFDKEPKKRIFLHLAKRFLKIITAFAISI
ncbi:hypothetical protein, partial [Veillonella sp.]|uniref:hypothetical protein n=1 Tax=Veillonella sp. TaxID=1926307 RepID=UPI0025D181B2